MSQQYENLNFIVTIEVFAKEVGVTVETVRCWIRNNTIPSVKLGKRRLVDVDTLRNNLSSEQ